jgi:hypothetical protein
MIVDETCITFTLEFRDFNEVLQMNMQPTCVHRYVATAIDAVICAHHDTPWHSDTVFYCSSQASCAPVVAGCER